MNKLFLFTILLFSGCVLLFSCNSGIPNSAGSTTTSFDTAAAKKAVDTGNRVVMESLAKDDSVTAANYYTTDAEFMASNAPAVVGRKSIQSEFAGLIKAGVNKLGLTTTKLWGSADLIAEQGTYTLAMKSGQQVDKGKYIVLWKKEDGKWKILRDCSNSNVAVTAGK